MKLRKPLVMAMIAAGPMFLMACASGCNSQQDIPLAKVDSPLPQPAQDKSKIKTPPGASPSVLPQ